MEIQLCSLFIMLFVPLGQSLIPYSFIQGWSYTDSVLGPAQWGTRFPQCNNGWWQSPVNVPFNTTGACLDHIRWLNLEWPRPQATIQNAWRNVKINFPDKSYPVVVQGGPLAKGVEYYLATISFHVGANETLGSLHHLRGKEYPGELTLLFTNDPNANETNWPTADSIVVLSFFIDISAYDNLNWDGIIRSLPALKRAGTNATIDLPSLSSLLPQYQDWETSYFAYVGSVAIPPCNEHATRVVYTTPINLSSRQINAFRHVCDEFGEVMVDNIRPVQPGRHNQNLRPATLTVKLYAFLMTQTAFSIGKSLTNNDGRQSLVPYSLVQGWSYTDSILAPDQWGTRFPQCKNTWWQSPVNLPYDTTGACLNRIQWLNLDWPRPQTSIQNAWRYVNINIPDKAYPVVIKGGPLAKGVEYYLASMSFHVGANDESGSSHVVRGKSYPGEWSLLFTNDPNLNETNWPSADSIVVLSFLIEISAYDNLNWDGIVRALPALKRAGTNATVDLPSLRSLLPQYQDWESSYFSYIGSIAIPPCNEHATRVVYTTPINFSSRQLNAFRQACDEFGEMIVNNQRPVQPERHNLYLRSTY